MGPSTSRALATGFSLVELLVAMTLGLLLTVGTVSVFSGSRRSTELNAAMANMQENARFALDAIGSDIRMAGHQGCASLAGGSVRIAADRAPMDDRARGLLGTAIWGSRVSAADAWTPAPPWGDGPGGFDVPDGVDSVVGTHALGVQFGDAEAARLRSPVGGAIPDPTGDIPLDRVIDLEAGDLAIVSDCAGGELFRVTGTVRSREGERDVMDLEHGASGNDGARLDTAYGANGTEAQVRVMRFEANAYFVGDTGLVNGAGAPVTALYQQSLPFGDADNPPVELVQGVENFRVSFGVRRPNGSLVYVPAGGALPDGGAFVPRDVRSVRIGLLMSSWDEIADDPDTGTYVLAGQPIGPATATPGGAAPGGAADPATTHPADRRFRLAFNTTVKVRNFRD